MIQCENARLLLFIGYLFRRIFEVNWSPNRKLCTKQNCFYILEPQVLFISKVAMVENDHSHFYLNQTHYHREGGLIGDPPRPRICP
ncbi:MAG: hypothetical protein A2Z38_06185 [Planctomycetes bacterium RBG_19FT_COMBO_48_8]|nr:MAG: hypothetical protein A2Z38_06185 [Planctomycetes bacterium RBG_19FT_COMBO_48_8]